MTANPKPRAKLEMRRLLFILIVIASSSCGLLFDGDVKEGRTRQFSTTSSELLPYVVSFEEQAKIQLKNDSFKVGDVPVNIGDTTDAKYDGVCIKYPDGTREILLKKSWFEKANEVQKEILIFHELGHCRLNRRHNSEKTMAYDNNLSIKVSIMNPVVPSTYYYSEYKDAYLKELFQQDTSGLISALEETNTDTDAETKTSAQGGMSLINCPHERH